MSLDVSPDGKQIVFDILGDLYLIPSPAAMRSPHHRPALGLPAALLTGWQANRLYQRQNRQRQHLADQHRRHRPSKSEEVTKETDDLLGLPPGRPTEIIWCGNTAHIPAPKTISAMSLWLFHKDGGKGIELVKGKGETTINSGAFFRADGKLLYFSSHAERFRTTWISAASRSTPLIATPAKSRTSRRITAAA